MIAYTCDFCGHPVQAEDMAPIGGGQHGGMTVVLDLGPDVLDGARVRVQVGPISANGLGNAHQWHKTCVIEMVVAGEVAS